MGISFIDLVVATRGQGLDGGANLCVTGNAESSSSFLQALAEAQSQLLAHAGADTPADGGDDAADAPADALLAAIDAEVDTSGSAVDIEEALLAMLAQMQSAMGAAPVPPGGELQAVQSASSVPAPGVQPDANASAPIASSVPPVAASAGIVAAMLDDVVADAAQSAAGDTPEAGTVPVSFSGAPGSGAPIASAVVWLDGFSLHVEQQDAGNSRAVARVKSATSETGRLATSASATPGTPDANLAQDVATGAALLEEAALRSRAAYVVHASAAAPEGHGAAGEIAAAGVELPSTKSVHATADVIQLSRPEPVAPQQSFPGVSIEKSAAPAAGDVTPQSHVRSSDGVTAPNRPVTLDALAEQTVRSIRYLAGREDGTLTVRLIPESLGEMHIEVHSSGDQMTVRLASSNAAVRHSMEANVPQLRDSLARDGFQVARIEVSANLASQAGAGHAGGRGDAYQAAPPPRHYASYTVADQNAQEPVQAVRRRPTHQGLVNLFV